MPRLWSPRKLTCSNAQNTLLKSARTCYSNTWRSPRHERYPCAALRCAARSSVDMISWLRRPGIIYKIYKILKYYNLYKHTKREYGVYIYNQIKVWKYWTFTICFQKNRNVRNKLVVSNVFWSCWCILYYKLIFWIWYSDYVSFSVYMKLRKCAFLKKKMSQKCEQCSYEIFWGIFWGCWVLNGPLTSLKHPSEGYKYSIEYV